MSRIPDQPGAFSDDDFTTSTARVRAAREKVLANPRAADAHQSLGEQIARRIEHKRSTLSEFRRAVEPPEPGHRAWPLRKTYRDTNNKGADEGTVFVRSPGRTAPASAAEMEMLSRRAAAAEQATPDIDVELEGDVPLSWLDDATVGDAITARSQRPRGRRSALLANSTPNGTIPTQSRAAQRTGRTISGKLAPARPRSRRWSPPQL